MNETGVDGQSGIIQETPSHFSSLKSRVKDRLPLNRPVHPAATSTPEEYFRVPGDHLPSHSPGTAGYEFTQRDWKIWLKHRQDLHDANGKSFATREGYSMPEGSSYTEDEYKKMGIMMKAFADGVVRTFRDYASEGTLPTGLALPPIFIGYAGDENLASVTADGERITLSSSSLGSFAGADINKPVKYKFSHGPVTPTQRITLAGIHEAVHIVYFAQHPELKQPNFIIKPEGGNIHISRPSGDESQSAYDAKPIELPAVRRELAYAISQQYPNLVIEALRQRIEAAEKKRDLQHLST